ncbi:N-acetylmuramoyl-L-alanine amidase CwlD [Paenibacillus sp. GSMTC-2017]|uniref:N-acetylmuramoyl-L-alanine amidase CwlD n=1 Tax=Paenibacillus sp. GSMTC-2017 TaxID=2794350 RepID=UPI0018D73299|nr:N-acetylmuramoyl-L-alanine amidase CwlD [Paenibacillus sp. GSMTC-2017]MBH5320760.1 N-acetylmuramoyl-L-alanine amidase CwlD [Paenibacillus sp. GSMTC-2017]
MRRIRRHFVIWMTYKGAVRIGIAVLVVVLTAIMLRQNIPSASTWTYWTLPLSGKTIAIDAGHGGADGGAVSKQGAIEKDLNLAIALYLRDYLQQAGAVVIMTREGDYDLATGDAHAYSKRKTEDLKRRAALINENNPATVISIHMNSIPQQKWSGAQTFYQPGNHPDNRVLAAFIQDEIKRNLENTTRIAAVVNGVYLMKAIKDIPTALVEVGFLSNPGEAERLVDAEYQRKVAASIYQGVLRYHSGEKLSGNANQELELQNGN